MREWLAKNIHSKEQSSAKQKVNLHLNAYLHTYVEHDGDTRMNGKNGFEEKKKGVRQTIAKSHLLGINETFSHRSQKTGDLQNNQLS